MKTRLTNAEMESLQKFVKQFVDTNGHEKLDRLLDRLKEEFHGFAMKINIKKVKRIIDGICRRRKMHCRVAGRLNDGTTRRQFLNMMASRNIQSYCGAAQLNLKPNDTAETIKRTLQMLCRPTGRAANKIYVLCLASLSEFDDSCMTVLINLLQSKGKRIFSVNLGEKPKVSIESWQKFCDCLPNTGVRYLFVDSVNLLSACQNQRKTKQLIRSMKDHLLESRRTDEALTNNNSISSCSSSSTPIWKCPIMLKTLRKCFKQNVSIDVALGKPWYYARSLNK